MTSYDTESPGNDCNRLYLCVDKHSLTGDDYSVSHRMGLLPSA